MKTPPAAPDDTLWNLLGEELDCAALPVPGGLPRETTDTVPPKRARLTPEQSTRVRSLIEDEGESRASAVAWVRAFGCAS